VVPRERHGAAGDDRKGRVDFLDLNIAEARNDSVQRAFGFRSTPHFFLADAGASPASRYGASFRRSACAARSTA